MMKIVIALSLILPLITPTSTPGFGPHSRYCAAIEWQDTSKMLGEILEDDSSLVSSLPLSKPINPAETAIDFYFVDHKGQRILDKKVVPLFRLKGALLI
jgi:hypothetical protein